MGKRLLPKAGAIILINSFLFFDAVWAGADRLVSFQPADCLSPAIRIDDRALIESFRFVTQDISAYQNQEIQSVLSGHRESIPYPELRQDSPDVQTFSPKNGKRLMYIGLAMRAQTIAVIPVSMLLYKIGEEWVHLYVIGSFLIAVVGNEVFAVGLLLWGITSILGARDYPDERGKGTIGREKISTIRQEPSDPQEHSGDGKTELDALISAVPPSSLREISPLDTKIPLSRVQTLVEMAI